jgi:eukaryotic-like serine/threonine-protein kinase
MEGDYAGTWIATIEQVHLPRRTNIVASSARQASDLWILVQERSSSVEAPVLTLGWKLQRESYIELASLLLVVLVLWGFVFRVGQRSLRFRRTDSQNPTLDAALESTVDANR